MGYVIMGFGDPSRRKVFLAKDAMHDVRLARARSGKGQCLGSIDFELE